MPAPELTPHVRALPAGRELDRVAMRCAEERTLLVDCAPLLADGERIDSVTQAQAQPAGVRVVGQLRARPGGALVEVPVRTPAAHDVKTWRDFSVSARLRTSRGQHLVMAFTVRVHRE